MGMIGPLPRRQGSIGDRVPNADHHRNASGKTGEKDREGKWDTIKKLTTQHP
jgi:hypothetical protein